MPGPLAVQGLADLQLALKHADRDVRLGIRAELRSLAQPAAANAQQLALSGIRRMPRSPQWTRMRIGVTRNEVYIVPRQKGTHGRGRHRRLNLADLLADRAMDPTRARFQPRMEREFELMLDRVADRFNRG